MKHTLKRLFSAFLVSCLLLTMFPLSVFASSTNGSSIIEVLSRASKTGFYYNFDGDTSFDGSRIVSGTEQDISRLKASTQGTVIVRYRKYGIYKSSPICGGKLHREGQIWRGYG